MADSNNSSYYQKLLDNANTQINESLPSAAATDDQMFARYLDRYKSMGQSAMKDTIGQASALTGGYANSYAQNAGQQAYDQYIQSANDQMLDYAQSSKQLALQQNEYANQLAESQYNRDLAQAQLGANYGDFSMYGNIYGSDYADAWKAMWDKMNPGLSGSSSSSGGGYYAGSTSSDNDKIDYDYAKKTIDTLNANSQYANGKLGNNEKVSDNVSASIQNNTNKATYNYIMSNLRGW